MMAAPTMGQTKGRRSCTGNPLHNVGQDSLRGRDTPKLTTGLGELINTQLLTAMVVPLR